MKDRKVRMIRMHQPTNIAKNVTHSIDYIRHKVNMELTPIGVHVTGENLDRLVTFNNIFEIELLPETTTKAKKE